MKALYQTPEALLLHLVEECAELQKECLVAERFGVDALHPNQKGKKISVAILDEIMDVKEAIDNVLEILPKPTIEEMVEEVLEWYERSELRFQAEFSETEFDSLPVFHSTLGESIMKRFNLWFYKWTPKIVNGVDMSPEHPDNLSMKVIEEAWRQVNAS